MSRCEPQPNEDDLAYRRRRDLARANYLMIEQHHDEDEKSFRDRLNAATDTLRTAITLHHSPGVTLAHGPVAYLLSAGAGLDVVGVRSWQLPPDLLAAVVAAHPRDGFKREFSAAFRTEATWVPDGRAQFLHRYGAFGLAIKTAPFRG